MLDHYIYYSTSSKSFFWSLFIENPPLIVFFAIIKEDLEESSLHVVWSSKNSSGDECLLAVLCRIFMGLEE